MHYSRLRSAVLLALAVPGLSYGQATPGQLEEIVVTAQKRSESLQDIPFSVAAVTEETLRRSGATNIVELARNVSGLAITDLGVEPVAIRGISAGQIIRDQPGVKVVGIYLDESAISVACSRRLTSTTSSASRCCAARRARCSVPARRRGRCGTSRGSRTSGSSAPRRTRPPPCRTASSAAE